MKKTKLISLVVAVLVFVITLFNPLGNKNKINEEDLIPVVMASEKIGPQTLITQDLVYTKKIYKDSVPEGAIKNADEVIGKVTKVNFMPDDVFMEEKIYEVGQATGGLGYVVEKGQRAVSLDVAYSTGVSGLLKVGNNTDIIGLVPPSQGEQAAGIGPKAKVILENVKILALDRKINPESETSEEGYATVTFEVTPEEALKLSVAIPNVQEIRLALRNQEDDSKLEKDEFNFFNVGN